LTLDKNVFRTVLKPRLIGDLNHFHRVFMIGSCFSEHIGLKLKERKFNIALNPFGILYHPLAISTSLSRLINNKPFVLSNLQFEADRHVSFYHHGKFNHRDPQIMLANVNDAFKKGREQLVNADYLFITWGTAYGYTHPSHFNRVVANCHKIPGQNFTKTLSQPEEIIKTYTHLFRDLKSLNPGLKIVLSISPVIHLKNGLVNNNLSKSTLLLAAHSLQSENAQCSYFPAYELIHDDLRDYRFYASDMVHPSEQAIDYVWDFFKNTYWNKSTFDVNKKVEAVLKAVNHRPLHPENTDYQQFIDSIKTKISLLKKDFPHFEFDFEL